MINFEVNKRHDVGLWSKIRYSKPTKCRFKNKLPTRRRKDRDTENDRENGLRMKNEMRMKEKVLVFLADPQVRKAKSQHTFGTLPFARHTSQCFANVKEPNLDSPQR